MPFTRFILPFAAPRFLGIFAIAALFAGVAIADHVLDVGLTASWALDPTLIREQPWRLLTWCFSQDGWVQASGNAVGLGIGLSMMARCSGQSAAWIGLLGSILLPALWAWHDMADSAELHGASTALYGALGMGIVSWRKMRHELTYTQRTDWVGGFAVLLLVGFTLAMPRILDAPARWIHIIGFTWGAGVALLAPRD
jgi:hypothetical protein